MKILLIAYGLAIFCFGFSQLIWGGSKKPQEPTPPEAGYGDGSFH